MLDAFGRFLVKAAVAMADRVGGDSRNARQGHEWHGTVTRSGAKESCLSMKQGCGGKREKGRHGTTFCCGAWTGSSPCDERRRAVVQTAGVEGTTTENRVFGNIEEFSAVGSEDRVFDRLLESKCL